MNYVPLFCRWTTLLLVVIIAAGATAVSFGLDDRLISEPTTAPEMVVQVNASEKLWAASEGTSIENSAPGQIIVVNADGSVRNNSTGLSTNDGASDEEIGDSIRDETDRDRSSPVGRPPSGMARRIE